MDEKFDKIETIYDLLIYAYERIQGNEDNSILSTYLEEMPEYRADITCLFREVLYNNLTIKEFLKKIAVYLEDDYKQVCMHILKEFDRFYGERDQYPLIRESTIETKLSYPPDNNISDNLAFYPIFNKNFIMESDVMADARVHKIYDEIWDGIKNYRINKYEKDKKVIITKYNNDWIKESLIQNKCLKVAVVPFSNEPPFREDKSSGILEYKNYSEEELNKIYEDCIKILEKFDEEKIDIVIFPEVVMRVELVERIKSWLTINAITGTNLKLIFIGSYYKDAINRCTLLSGGGVKLVINDKQNGFEYKDKNNNIHRENLGDKLNNINLVDIKGLGRVWYTICKDALVFSNVIAIIEKYACNIQMVSCYTRSLKDFRDSGELLSRKYQVLSVIANSCAARELQSEAIGFISYPVLAKDKTKSTDNRNIDYNCCDRCMKESYCKCGHVFCFYMEAETYEGCESLKVDNNQILV